MDRKNNQDKSFSKELLKLFVYLLFVFLIFIICAEAGARFFINSLIPLDPYLEVDPKLEWKFKPDQSFVLTSPDNKKITNTINSKGLKGEEFGEKQTNTTRILVPGGSFTAAVHVNTQDCYTNILELKLNEANNKNYEVINAGVYGYDLAQENTFLKEDGFSYNPDLVILSFYTKTHIKNYGKPQKGLFGSLLSSLSKNSYLFYYIRKIGEKEDPDLSTENAIKASLDSYKSILKSYHSKLPDDDVLARYITQYINEVDFFTTLDNAKLSMLSESEQMIELIYEECNKRNLKTLFVVIPSKRQVIPSEKEKTQLLYNQYYDNREIINLDKVHNKFIEDLKENNIPILDLLPELRKEENPEELYFEFDGHWNKNGHSAVAGIIYNYLVENNLIE